MKTILNPYINFNGKAREAMEFYKSVFGGELNIKTFKDFGVSQDPSTENNVMHSDLHAPNGIVLMGSDGVGGDAYVKGNNFSISLTGDNAEELTNYYDKLSEGGKIVQPLTKAVWGDSFGMLSDKYGILWLINISNAKTKE